MRTTVCGFSYRDLTESGKIKILVNEFKKNDRFSNCEHHLEFV